MILPLVAELLLRVGKLPAVEEVFDLLRRGPNETRIGGPTAAAKALLAALAAVELGRPIVMLVESNQRAEDLCEPLRFFYRALTGKPGSRVAVLPAHEVLPYDHLSPHAELSEARAVSLWRFASGEIDVLLAPATAALLRLREPEFYRQFALTVERGEEIPLDSLIEHLASVGYERHETVEMPGQFSVRGGIVDIYSPEATRPVRLELFGDTVESLREFDPNTQRSTSPVARTTLLPLTDYPRRSELLARLHARVVAGLAEAEEETDVRADFFPGWEFQAALVEPLESSLLTLASDTVLIEDEPETLKTAIEKFRVRLADAFENSSASIPPAAPPERYFLSEEEARQVRSRVPRLLVEQLALEQPESVAHRLSTQPTPRYHGNVSAFMAEVRGRLNGGDQVIIAAFEHGGTRALCGYLP